MSAAERAAELEEYRRQTEAIKIDAEKLLSGLSDADFNWTPQPGRWSIAECIDHLNTTGRQFLPVLDRMIEEGRARKLFAKGPFKHGFLGNWVVRSSEPPPKIKFKAPKLFRSTPAQALAEVGPAFMELQEQLLKRIEEANGLNLSRIKAPSPVTKLLKISLGQWLAMILAHERRHLWQAWQVKNDARFPVKNS